MFGETGRGMLDRISHCTIFEASTKRFYSDDFRRRFRHEFNDSDRTMAAGSGLHSLTMLSIDGCRPGCHCAFVRVDRGMNRMPARWATYFMVEDIHASVASRQNPSEPIVGVPSVMDVPPGSLAFARNRRSSRSAFQFVAGSRASWLGGSDLPIDLVYRTSTLDNLR